ncbi:hypothetical protein [Salegentibacter chungangensis]|uniref:Calcium-binding protein n=1 Tax=Salegentibacter chungangensis TaxID=1335724 RepID=A0ABW3NV47_9FLAO
MKKLFTLLCLTAILTSCDSGDIIVTSFDLEGSKLNLCGTADDKVLYVINNGEVNESMSLQVSNRNLEDSLENVLTTNTDQDLSIALSDQNRLIYRLYDGEVPNDYFCNQVPPRNPGVIEEYWSTTGGTINISTNFNDLAGDDDPDGDNLESQDEGWDPDNGNHRDTDNDGIPDYLDLDDDGDNVATIRETTAGDEDPTAEGFLDTDADGTPNYLDADDDGDGALTRLEVSPDDLDNPEAFQEAENIPNYLNDQIDTTQPEHNLYISHNISRRYRSQVTLLDFKLVKQDGSGEEIRFDRYNLGYFDSASVNFSLIPFSDETEEESAEQ